MENSKKLPLEGIRVIDITTAWAGPVVGMMLADMGAEVIKIEGPKRPDVTRLLEPFADGISGINRSGYFAVCNRGKKDCTMDLKTPEAVNVMKRLVKVSDILVENFPPRVMDSLGLGYSVLKEIKPDLIMISESGYGATGPDKECLAYGPVLEAYSGLSSLIGYPDKPPLGSLLPTSDQAAATSSVFAALCALHYRKITGEGQHIDVSEIETLINCIPEAIMEYTMNQRQPLPPGNRDEVMAPHGCYRCQGEDNWIAIAINTDEEWQGLCKVMGKPELTDDERFQDGFLRWKNEDELNEIITEWAKDKNHIAVFKQLQEAGVASGPAYDNEALFNDPQLRAREFFAEIEHPEVGKRELLGVFARLSETPGAVRRDPLFGEHNDWLLNELLADVDIQQ